MQPKFLAPKSCIRSKRLDNMDLRFIVDENIEVEIVEAIRKMGYDVEYVAETDPGATDEVLLQKARHLGAILVTNDKDFGELVFRRKQVTAGVLLLRLPGVDPDRKADLVAKAVADHAGRFQGSFTVLGRRAIRVRTDL